MLDNFGNLRRMLKHLTNSLMAQVLQELVAARYELRNGVALKVLHAIAATGNLCILLFLLARRGGCGVRRELIRELLADPED